MNDSLRYQRLQRLLLSSFTAPHQPSARLSIRSLVAYNRLLDGKLRRSVRFGGLNRFHEVEGIEPGERVWSATTTATNPDVAPVAPVRALVVASLDIGLHRFL